MAKEKELRRVLEDEYRLVPVHAVRVGKDPVYTGRKLNEYDARYLSSEIGATVAVAYVKICTRCGAAVSPRLTRCSRCGAWLTSKKIVSLQEEVIRPPPPSEVKSNENLLDPLELTEYLVVDGSNLATGPGDVGHVGTLQKVLKQMKKTPGRSEIFVGSAFWREVDDSCSNRK